MNRKRKDHDSDTYEDDLSSSYKDDDESKSSEYSYDSGGKESEPYDMFANLFDTAWEKLIGAYDVNETEEEESMRKKDFTDFYDSFVKVKGSLKCSGKTKVWSMNHSTGCVPPPSMQYLIKVKAHMHKKEKWQPLFIVKKSTLGTDENGNIVDTDLHRKSGFGLFAARDFVKGEYIGRYLGEVIQRRYDRDGNPEFTNSSYSLDLGDDLIIDPGGGMWSPWYFGHHMINDPLDPNKNNIEVAANLMFFTTRNIRAGEELFFSYGEEYWLQVKK
jgi:hypothetical protein